MLWEAFCNLPLPFIICLAVSAFVLCWRLWAFTIKPSIWTCLPRELPYWTPLEGHSVEFFRNSERLIERGLNYSGRTYEPFALQLLGIKIYIITAPKDITAVFSNTTSLTFDGNLKQLLANFGVTRQAFEKAWHNPQPGDWCYIPNNKLNPAQLNLIHFVEESYRKQLLPGEHMDRLSEAFINPLLDTLNMDALDFYLGPTHEDVGIQSGLFNEPVGGPLRLTSLYSLCRVFIVEAATRSLFGQHLHDIEPDIVDLMTEFNENAWMVAFGYPKILSSAVSGVKQKVMTALAKFILLPEEKRTQEAWVVKTILAAMELVDIDIESRAAMLLMSFWAAISNEYNTVFWVLSYLLYDPNLFEQVKTETEAAWRSDDGKPDIKSLCANSPHLESVLNETLRIKNSAGALRVVVEETQVGTKTLQAGNAILIPFRQLHSNRNVWGPSVDEFDPYRFLKRRSLARHPSFRPFGGGGTLCPGRTLAKEQVFGFIAILLHRFDVKLAAGPETQQQQQPFPRLNDLAPSLGIGRPVKGMDVMVYLADSQRGC
ncbi:cytochrome P450 [Nemania sp. NC0429]|nr:cytochrome P450 [Nemania sp. NC0429]